MDPSPPDGPAQPDDGIPTVPRFTRRLARPTVLAPPFLPRARRVEVHPTRPAAPPVVERRVASVLPLLLTLGVFAGMMAVSFGQGVYALFSEPDLMSLGERQAKDRLINETMVFEGLDAVIVLAGVLIAGRPLARAAAGGRLLTWALAGPGFLVLLGTNLGYHLLLKWMVSQLVQVPPPDETVVIDISLKDGWWALLLVCVQPAFVEEFFFRYLLLGHLRPHLGTHGAVWVSAVIFGMAHLGNIPGWPVLILLGAGLGYARAYSGGLALPICLHFLHNLAVLGIDYAVLH